MAATITLEVNGKQESVACEPGSTLLGVLRDHLGLTGTKSGCDRGECGACTVLVDGRPVPSCVVPAALVSGAVTTIEGLAAEAASLRAAFADTGAFQCGFCTPGQIVTGVALLRAGMPPGDDEARRAISGCICRCTGYDPIVRALRAASQEIGA